MSAKQSYYDALAAAGETFELWALKVPSYDPAPLRAVVWAWEADLLSGYHVSQFSRNGLYGQAALDSLYVDAAAQVVKNHAVLGRMSFGAVEGGASWGSAGSAYNSMGM